MCAVPVVPGLAASMTASGPTTMYTPPKETWLTAAKGKGLEIKGTFTRRVSGLWVKLIMPFVLCLRYMGRFNNRRPNPPHAERANVHGHVIHQQSNAAHVGLRDAVQQEQVKHAGVATVQLLSAAFPELGHEV